MDSRTSALKIMVYILAAIGLVAVIFIIGMWIMHKSMMGRLGEFDKDQAHRVVIASTRQHVAPLVTKDQKIHAYTTVKIMR